LSLDLCGIAKGYALDEIVRALDGLDFLIELGGEVAARGRHPSGRPWRAGIERPESNALQRIVEVDARALATSGDAQQSYVVGGRRYAHVLDPRTQAPVDNGVASVSVLAASGLIADGLATAAMVLGPQAARPLLKAREASALFLMRRPGGLEEVDVNGFVAGGAS
jgi:thiamine biosynthesis lipoprotein